MGSFIVRAAPVPSLESSRLSVEPLLLCETAFAHFVKSQFVPCNF